MKPYYEADRVTLYLADCVDAMRALPAESVDAIVTDPPYGLNEYKPAELRAMLAAWIEGERYDKRGRGFMGKSWDSSVPGPDVWAEAIRVLKPGGHLLAFSSSRTFDFLALALRLAGFEIRDTLAWLYGSGFPKNLDVSKAIDKAAGAEREIVGRYRPPNGTEWNLSDDVTRSEVGAIGHTSRANSLNITAPATDDAREWEGWGTALKPAYEPVVMARKPFRGTVAANVLTHGTGGINVDACRIPFAGAADEAETKGKNRHADFESDTGAIVAYGDFSMVAPANYDPPGRWPPNVILDLEAAAILDAQTGNVGGGFGTRGTHADDGLKFGYSNVAGSPIGYGDAGGPSRLFYTSKASRSEREAGLDALPLGLRTDSDARDPDAAGSDNPRLRVSERRNTHPTVKPVDVMAWLCRLVTPPGGVVLDPFLGSGTTAMAALDEGFACIGIELEPEYVEYARHRVAHRHLLEVATVEASPDQNQGRLL